MPKMRLFRFAPWGVLIIMVGSLVVACGEPPTVIVQPLRVINWSPGSGSVCVDTGAKIQVTFSDDIVTDTLTVDTLQLLGSNGPLTAALAYDKSSFTATLTPSTDLDFNRLYTVSAGQAVTGAELGPLPVELQSSFHTVGRAGCTPPAECQLASDCPGTQICSSIGSCIDACVTNRDCPGGTVCAGGTCS